MTSPSPGKKPSRARFVILILLLVGTMVNYLDRTVMSVAAPKIRAEWGLTPAEYGWIASSFAWAYALAQLPGGFVLDRLGTKLTYFLSVTVWSIFTVAQGFAVGLRSLVGCRIGLGAAEAPCFPANSRVLLAWFPQQERARATSIFSIGMYAGIGFLTVPLTWVMNNWGWRVMIIGVGSVGIVFGLVWLAVFREPQDSKLANQAELDHIKAGGGLGEVPAKVAFKWSNLAWLLSRRQIVGAAIGQFAGNCTLVFFITWFVPYLAEKPDMGWIRLGYSAGMPFLAAAVGCLTGGFVSDFLLRKTGSPTLARKLPVIVGLALASSIMLANYATTNTLLITVMCIAFFGQGWINLGWTLITDVAPRKLQGQTAGFFNFVTNFAGIVVPLIVGYVRGSTGSYFWALAFISAMAVVGAISYIFLVGEVKRLEFEEKA
jgi:ACS family D-galactonate transporter-like MFS transporter